MKKENTQGMGLKVMETVIKDSIRNEYGDDSVFYRMLAGSVLTRYFEAEGSGCYVGKKQNKRRLNRFEPGKTNMEGFL
jgi:hypothetical protein